MINLDVNTSSDICDHIAKHARGLRKAKGLTQAELSKKSGVSLGSLKRFENTSQISLHSLANIAIALQAEEEFLELFTRPHYNSIDEVIRGNM